MKNQLVNIVNYIKDIFRAFAKRTIFACALLFALGICLGFFISLPIWVWCIGVVSIIVLRLLWLKTEKKHVSILFILILAFFVGGLRISLVCPAKHSYIPYDNDVVTMQGIVCQSPIKYDDKAQIVLYGVYVSRDGKGYSLNGNVKVSIDGELTDEIEYGSIVKLKAKLSIPKTQSYIGGFDYRTYLQAQGILYIAYADEYGVELIETPSTINPMFWASKARESVEASIDALYSGDVASVIKGITLGEEYELSDQSYQAFKDTGIAHVLAVSGLHVGLIILILLMLLKLLRVRSIAQWWIVLVILLFYCMMVSFTPSVLRASIMAMVVLYARFFGHRQDGLLSLGVAMIIMLLINPLDLLTAGFQLSFGATLGILLLYRAILDLFKWMPKYFSQSIAVCLSAQIGIAPIMINTFNSYSLITVLANLLILPLIMFLVAGGWLSIFVFAIFNTLAAWISAICSWICEWILYFVNAMASIDFAAINMVSWPIWVCALWMITIFILSNSSSMIMKRRVKAACIIIITTIFVLGMGWILPNRLKIVMLDVGMAECIVVTTPDHKAYLIDCGVDYIHQDEDDSQITEYLLKNGINKLEGIILSHAHADHTYGLAYIEQVFNPEWVMVGGGLKEADDIKCETQIKKTNEGQIINLGSDVIIEVISEGDGEGNEECLIFTLDYGDFSMMFTGDAGFEQEYTFLNKVKDVDVLKAGHHGSKNSTSYELLNAISPEVVLISVGSNSYGLPNKETIDRIVGRGIDLFRTDQDGCIEVVCTKEDYQIILNRESIE